MNGRSATIAVLVLAGFLIVGIGLRTQPPAAACTPGELGCASDGGAGSTPATAKPKATLVVLPQRTFTSSGAPSAPQMDVTFADEFDGNDVGPEWGRSWFRIGQTLWSSDQSTVADGILTITAKRTAAGWVSSELDTLESFTQRYGHFSARIKAPAGRGLWPTFWLAEGWRKSHAEIDIMEICANPPGTHDGNDQTVLHHFVHAPTGEHLHETAIPVANLTGVWHVFELDWRRERMSFVVDGVEVYAVTDAATIPNRDMAIVIDLAVGGWCGEPDETTPNPSELQIDWIRATE